jgi:hypothetical protein
MFEASFLSHSAKNRNSFSFRSLFWGRNRNNDEFVNSARLRKQSGRRSVMGFTAL